MCLKAVFRGGTSLLGHKCVAEVLDAREAGSGGDLRHRQDSRRQVAAGLVDARTHDLLLHGRAQDAAENGFHDRMRTTEVGKDIGGGRSPDHVAPDEDERV